MFYDAEKFNQDISNWNMSNVEYIRSMFDGTTSFNQNISNWELKKIKNYYYFAPNLQQEYKPKLNFKKRIRSLVEEYKEMLILLLFIVIFSASLFSPFFFKWLYLNIFGSFK
ncbi:BspA family leucine-rich repeat surface protein [Mycoplasma capricolum]